MVNYLIWQANSILFKALEVTHHVQVLRMCNQAEEDREGKAEEEVSFN
jgi:hypothetical protein